MTTKTKYGILCQISIILLFLFAGNISAQSNPISGPTSVLEGSTNDYYLTSGTSTSGWNVFGATKISETGFSVKVLAGSSSYTISTNITSGTGGGYAAKQVTVTANPPPKPSNPTASTANCQVSLASTGPVNQPNVTWYWQGTSSSGKSTNKGTSASSFTATTTGTYYIRAYNSSTGLWSDQLGFKAVTLPSTPPTPSLSGNNPRTICLGTQTTLPVSSPNTSSYDYLWYNSAGTQVHTGTTYAVIPTSNTSYSVRARSKTTGCLSNARTMVIESANPQPPNTSGGQNTCFDNTSIDLGVLSRPSKCLN